MHIQLSNKVLNTVMQNNQLLEFLFYYDFYFFDNIHTPSSPGNKRTPTKIPLTRYVDKLIVVNTYCKY